MEKQLSRQNIAQGGPDEYRKALLSDDKATPSHAS